MDSDCIKSFDAEVEIPAYSIVKAGSATGKVTLATDDNDKLIGITGQLITGLGSKADVTLCELWELVLGGTVAMGDFLTTDASGHGVVAVTGSTIIAKALDAGVAGQQIRCVITHGIKP
jgi:delta 1-pyrroline-5-carboxylate dehydrogenase